MKHAIKNVEYSRFILVQKAGFSLANGDQSHQAEFIFLRHKFPGPKNCGCTLLCIQLSHLAPREVLEVVLNLIDVDEGMVAQSNEGLSFSLCLKASCKQYFSRITVSLARDVKNDELAGLQAAKSDMTLSLPRTGQ